jgi:hypothetical protein
MVSVFDMDLAIVLGPFALSHEKRLFNTSRLSVRLHQLGSQRTNISQSGTGDFYENLPKNPQIWLKSDKNIGLFTWRHAILLYCRGQHEILCSSTTQRETILVSMEAPNTFPLLTATPRWKIQNGPYCCVSMSTMLTRKRHNITCTLFYL